MPPAELVERILNACPEALIGAGSHLSPCSSVYGSKNGFSSLKECFGDLADEITWVETGLSGDPGMCWRFGDLDGKQIVSARPQNRSETLGRECTLFKGDLTYSGLAHALKACRERRFKERLRRCPSWDRTSSTAIANVRLPNHRSRLISKAGGALPAGSS
jgi:PHP family Zn ribbon phosphoesterase